MTEKTAALIALLEANGFRKEKPSARVEELKLTEHYYYKTYLKEGTSLAMSAYITINEWDDIEAPIENEYGETEIIKESWSDHDGIGLQLTEKDFEVPDLIDLEEIVKSARVELTRIEEELDKLEFPRQ